MKKNIQQTKESFDTFFMIVGSGIGALTLYSAFLSIWPQSLPDGIDPTRYENAMAVMHGSAPKNVLAASVLHDVPVSDAMAQRQAESSGLSNATSYHWVNGKRVPLAKGEFQIIDSTAKLLGVNDPYNPVQSAAGGLKYYKQLLKLTKGDKDLARACYNAGPTACMRYGRDIFLKPITVWKNGKAYNDFYKETRDYVARINAIEAAEELKRFETDTL